VPAKKHFFLENVVSGVARRSRARRRTSMLPLLGAGALVVLLLQVLQTLRAPGPPTPLTDEQRLFIGQVGGAARRLRPEVGLPPSLVTAMAINETGWGRSSLSRLAHNYFGIKAAPGSQGVLEPTQEVIEGRWVTVWARFRAYASLEESVRDLGQFLRANPRYDAVWPTAINPRLTARTLLAAGYATDPDWADKLIRLIDSYNLEALDGLAPPAAGFQGEQ
jgi:lysozyme